MEKDNLIEEDFDQELHEHFAFKIDSLYDTKEHPPDPTWNETPLTLRPRFLQVSKISDQ